MSRWDPHVDLARLVDALAQEIIRTSDDEVRRPYGWAHRGAVAQSAGEVRTLIAAVLGDEPDPGLVVAQAALRRERYARQH